MIMIEETIDDQDSVLTGSDLMLDIQEVSPGAEVEVNDDPEEPSEEPSNDADNEQTTVKRVMPDSVSTDSGVSSGFDESEGDTEFYYEKPKHLNA